MRLLPDDSLNIMICYFDFKGLEVVSVTFKVDPFPHNLSGLSQYYNTFEYVKASFPHNLVLSVTRGSQNISGKRGQGPAGLNFSNWRGRITW